MQTDSVPHSETPSDPELKVLLHVSEKSDARQRDIAQAVGVSLGLTNAIVKRLVKKGLLTASRVNGKRLAYAVTPDGTHEIARRTYRYLRRTIGHVVRYKEAVDAQVLAAKTRGARVVVLIGKSDVSFIVEYAALRHGLDFKVLKPREADTLEPDATGRNEATPCVFFGEKEKHGTHGGVYLAELLGRGK